MSKDLENHFKGKRLRLSAEHERAVRREREGLFVPMTRWRCRCGRRFLGEARVHGHLERSGHGVATGER